MNARALNWYFQRITGAALLLLLIMHFWVEHFTAEVRTGGLTYDIIQKRFFHNPWFVSVDLAFLFIALYHGLNGVRSIVLDFGRVKPGAKPIVTFVLIAFGFVVAYWGVTAFVGNDKFFQQPPSNSEASVASVR